MAAHAAVPAQWFPPEAVKKDTIVMARWALILAAGYLVLFSQTTIDARTAGMVTTAVFLASNLFLARMPAEKLASPAVSAGIVVLDSVLIALALYLGGHLTVPLLVLCIGVVTLALSGLSLGIVAMVTLWLTGAYLFISWQLGHQEVWTSGMLLQMPFLLCAALVYGWVTEHGMSRAPAPGENARQVSAALEAQRGAIERCQKALVDGAPRIAEAALHDVLAEHQRLRSSLAPSS
jgi:hypothetical protein